MRRIIIVTLFVYLCAAFNTTLAQDLSNRGKEFWLGYGHNSLFDAGNNQQLVLYLSTEQAATVTVAVNGTSFSQTYNIAANTVLQTVEIPKAGASDARIRSEGLSSRGISISSNVPIVAYAHQYGQNSSGATMLMPVETYGYTYYSLNYTQVTNASQAAYSWFFIVASENNTRVEITPSVQTQNGRTANVPFIVNLNRGQIYNVFGQTFGLTGLDLTGSKIKSIAGPDGICHPIGVYSGASRMVICGESGEYMQQQIFPASAWGTKYLTNPTIRTNAIGQNNNNFYRVAVRDPTTVVKRNGVVLSNLQRNFYYEFSGNAGEYIEANKPILVAQYAPSEQPSSGCSYFGVGDPEMFFLSPLEQAINSATFYATSNQNISNVYVSIIIPAGGISTLTVNGNNAFDVIRAHPQNAAYRIAVKRLSPNAQYAIKSDSAFTAITYGLGSVESYGYNAGTLVNNLDAVPAIQNVLSQTGANTFTCPGAPFNFSVKLAYKPTQLTWKLSQVNKLTPAQDTILNNPVASDSSLNGSRLYYEFRLPRAYSFSDTGVYNIPITITAPDIDNCNNTIDITFSVKVNPPPKADFSINYTGCKLDTALLSGTFTGTGYAVSRYRWTFPDGTTDTLQNVKKLFTIEASHNVRLRIIADNGCVGDTIKTVLTSAPPVATFGITPGSACIGSTITVTDTSSYAGGSIHNWYWDFGNGTIINAPTKAPQSDIYTAPGVYTIRHFAQAGSCPGDTAKKTVTIFAKPTASFILPVGCLADSTAQFINTSTVPDGQQLKYLWNFGDANANASNPNTDTARNPSHKYSAYGTYSVSLITTTVNGCAHTLIVPFTPGGFSAAINYTVINESALCVQNPVQVRNDMNVAMDSIYRIDIYWDFINQPAIFTQVNNPTANAVFSHTYPAFTNPATQLYTLKWVIYSKGGCVSEKSKTITLNGVPVASLTAFPSLCINANPVTLTQGFASNNLPGTGQYSGNGIVGTNTFDPRIAGVGTHTIKYLFTTSSGCKDSTTGSITVHPRPVVNWNYTAQCDSIRFSTSSSPVANIASWNWTFGDGNSEVRTDGLPFSKKYNAAGSYNASLHVISTNGCTSDTLARPVNVSPLPVPSFTVANENQLCSRNQVTLTNTTNPGSDTISRLDIYWDFVNQPSVIQSINSPVANAQYMHQYPSFTSPASKSVVVKWVIFSRGGCATEVSKTITLHALPVVSFPPLANMCVNDAPITLQASATNVQGTDVYFGNGITAGGVFTPSQAGAGNHRLKYVFTSVGGCIDSAFTSVLVSPQPVANFGFTSVCKGDSTLFTDSSSIASGNITSWQWIFGDGTTSTDRPPFKKIYQDFGTYTVQLIASSDSGCSSVPVSKTFKVNAQPVVNFELPASVCLPGGMANFTNLSTLPNGSLSELSFNWNFGDGNTATGFNASHVYADSNLYTITLSATSLAGCVNDTSKTFSNFFRKPVADFDVAGSTICQGEETQFLDRSVAPSSSISTYAWSFGDGTVSSDSMPTKTFATPGTFSVKLSVTTAEGCTADTTKTVLVYLQPQVDAGTSVYIPQGTIYQLQPVVNDTTLRFRWTPATLLNNDTILYPFFNALATQTLMLQATGEGNCTGSDTVRITVLKPLRVPNAFSPNGDGINDLWIIQDLAEYPGNRVEIFDRYGQLVYSTTGYTKPWDGTKNGKPLPVGTYYYLIDLRQPGYQPLKGYITILK